MIGPETGRQHHGANVSGGQVERQAEPVRNGGVFGPGDSGHHNQADRRLGAGIEWEGGGARQAWTAPATPNAVTVDLNGSGQFDIYNLQGSVDVSVDVVGY